MHSHTSKGQKRIQPASFQEPGTYGYLNLLMENANKSDDQDEISRVEKLAEMKKEQLTYGIDQVYDKLAKLTRDMFAPPMVFTLMTHAVHGAKVTRAILLKCQEAGLDLDKVFGVDKDMSLIDTNLDWKLYSPEDMTAFEKSLYDKLDGCGEDLIHFYVSLV